MKKLSCFSDDHWVVIRGIADKLNEAIDLVNSQQEAIEKLEKRLELTERRARYACLHALKRENEEPADDKPEYKLPGTEEIIEKLDKVTLRPNLVDDILPDTHRTIDPRDMASRNPSPEAREALETAVQQSQDDMNKVSTHRTVTLRIPREKTIAEAVIEACGFNGKSYFLPTNTDLQKALERRSKNE